MKTIIAGTCYVLKSDCTKADLEKVQKHSPEALTIIDEKEKPIFALGIGDVPQVTRFGVVYNDETRDDKHACITLPLPKGVNAEEYVVDKLLPILDKVNKVEDGVPAAIAAIEAKRADVAAAINVQA